MAEAVATKEAVKTQETTETKEAVKTQETTETKEAVKTQETTETKEAVKTQEFKDFSLTKDVLINELTEIEITAVLSTRKPKDTKKEDEEPEIVERFVCAAIEHLKRMKTENEASTYRSSDDPRLDFFFQVLEDTGREKAVEILEASWKSNCLDTLRLLAYLRDIRNGKAIRYPYYVCLLWLYDYHPRTLLQNLSILIDCGCWKDPLYLLMMIAFDGNVPKEVFGGYFPVLAVRKQRAIKNKKLSKTPKEKKIKRVFYEATASNLNSQLIEKNRDEIDKKLGKITVRQYFTSEQILEEVNKANDPHDAVRNLVGNYKSRYESKFGTTLEGDKLVRSREVHEVSKKCLEELRFKNARDRFNNDKKYRYFHLKIAELFAKQLIEDSKKNADDKKNKVSLAAKWAPSLNGHFDRYLLIASSISLQVAKLTREQDPSLDEIFSKPIPIATYLARKNYQKNYIVKLRDQLKIPEKFMCSNQWDVLPYQMVPSKSMQQNRKQFMKHDLERFEKFVASKEKIAGGTLKPPELVNRAIELVREKNNELELELLEKQWISLKESIKLDDKESCFKSALCVCDVSGSMSGTPMLAAIGLTIMTMSFSNEPWSSICLTFSEEPTFVHIKKNLTLFEKVQEISKAPAGYNTNLTKTFELILDLAKKHELQQSEMPKFLFIFTDMEFDTACRPEETNFEEATRLFTEAGYKLPTVIFWNLRSSRSVPIQKGEADTILISGYSSQQLSLMLNTNIDNITPEIFLNKVLQMKKYEDLVVVD